MKRQKRQVVLWVAFVLMVLCAVRDVRRPTASRGAQKIGVRAGRAQADEKETDARFKQATESTDANDAKPDNELRLRQLQAAGKAQPARQPVPMSAQTPAPPAGQ